MPIQRLGNLTHVDDSHVTADHATTELWNTHVWVMDTAGATHTAQQYDAHHNDVAFKFIPHFTGKVTGHVHSGFGIDVNLVTGQVLLKKTLPATRPHNFILEVEAKHKPSGPALRQRLRIHVHEAYERIWLTPDRLSIRRQNATGSEFLGCRFSLRALFTDGVVGDVTDNREVRWGPAAANPKNVDGGGNLSFAASDAAGTNITIRASISFAPTVFDEAILHVDQPWSASPPLVAELVPGSIRMPSPDLAIEIASGAVVPAEHVPTVLFIGDGFTDTEAPALRSFVIDIAHSLRQDAISFPWTLMRGSMNFWMVHVPAAQYGISIGAEVATENLGAGPVTGIVPAPVSAPTLQAGQFWKIEHRIHELGLPLPADGARPNSDILDHWKKLLGRDPSAELGGSAKAVNDAIDEWKRLSTRGLVDEVDSPLGCIWGKLNLENPEMVDLYIRRGHREGMNSLLRAIVADLPDPTTGVVTRKPIGHLWAKRADGSRPPDFDLICVITPSTGRTPNGDGYFFVKMFADEDSDTVHVLLPSPGNRYEVATKPPVDRGSASGEHGRVLAHELSHSFNLGDEYGELRGPPAGAVTESNLQAETDAQRGTGAARALHGDEIKWLWHRIEAVGVVSAKLVLASGVLTVPLRHLEAVFFKAGDIVHLRQRSARNPLIKSPKLSGQMVVDSVDVAANLVRIRATGVVVKYPNLVPITSAVATFGIGSILYRPVPAPASVRHATDYPYAELVAHNIKSFITRNRRPLVAFPPANNVPVGTDGSEQVPVFVPDAVPGGLVLAPGFKATDHVRIVGLYAGGARSHLGVFHPAGHCMMRSDLMPSREFCAVCRYILVDTIDPSLHDLVDREYAAKYPQA